MCATKCNRLQGENMNTCHQNVHIDVDTHTHKGLQWRCQKAATASCNLESFRLHNMRVKVDTYSRPVGAKSTSQQSRMNNQRIQKPQEAASVLQPQRHGLAAPDSRPNDVVDTVRR